MKTFPIHVFALLILMLSLGSCQENMPEIACLSCTDDDTNTTELQDRVVLIEEFTGVRCVNCPQGSAEIQNLLSVYGDQLIAVSIHAGFFSRPYPDNIYDFQTNAGDQILNFLEEPVGYPSAVVDRKLFDGEVELQVGQTSWGGYIALQLEQGQADASLVISNDFNADNRELSTTVEIQPIVDLEGDYALTMMLVENDIEDLQLTPDGLQADYKHKHVFRDVMSANALGDAVSDPLTVGSSVEISAKYTLPIGWNEDKCEVIAFLHKTGTEKEVVQAALELIK
ncbi:MAG: Omp28-related outer membrane protein [Bacteroidota bacterium]